MKCKCCGAELIPNYPWWDCPNCKTSWKLIGISEDGFLMQPYKELPANPELVEKFKSLNIPVWRKSLLPFKFPRIYNGLLVWDGYEISLNELKKLPRDE